MTNFPNSLVLNMYNANVRFDCILHVPTLTASMSDKISDQFQNFLTDAKQDELCKELIRDNPNLKSTLVEIQKNEDISDFAAEVATDLFRLGEGLDFLIKLNIGFPIDFEFNEKAEWQSNGIEGYITKWVFAKNMRHAAKLAVKHSNALWSVEYKKALKAHKAQSKKQVALAS